jgi:nicotinamidase-related amidase
MNSHEPTMIMNNVAGLAKAGKLFGVPTLLSTVLKDCGGRLLQSVQDVFPKQTPIDRSLINSWQDERFVEAVRNSGRRQLVLAALWTEICLAMTAVQALGDGYDVFIVTDASGGASVEAHEMAVRRMVAAGAVPITWLAVASEWQRDWAREDTVDGFSNILMEHGGASSVALGWEQQLLTSRRTTSS